MVTREAEGLSCWRPKEWPRSAVRQRSGPDPWIHEHPGVTRTTLQRGQTAPAGPATTGRENGPTGA